MKPADKVSFRYNIHDNSNRIIIDDVEMPFNLQEGPEVVYRDGHMVKVVFTAEVLLQSPTIRTSWGKPGDKLKVESGTVEPARSIVLKRINDRVAPYLRWNSGYGAWQWSDNPDSYETDMGHLWKGSWIEVCQSYTGEYEVISNG